MSPVEKPAPFVPSASEYILDNFESADRIAMLVLNRDFGETIQRITNAQKASSPEFQAWLRYKNANGSDIYIGMNPLKQDAQPEPKKKSNPSGMSISTWTTDASQALESLENSSAVPKPNYVLNSSPGKHQMVWKVEGMSLEEAEGLLHAWCANSAATPPPPTRRACCGFPDSPTKNMERISMSKPAERSTEIYHLRDFKLHIDSQDSPRHNYENRTKRASPFGPFEPVGTRLGFRQTRTGPRR